MLEIWSKVFTFLKRALLPADPFCKLISSGFWVCFWFFTLFFKNVLSWIELCHFLHSLSSLQPLSAFPPVSPSYTPYSQLDYFFVFLWHKYMNICLCYKYNPRNLFLLSVCTCYPRLRILHWITSKIAHPWEKMLGSILRISARALCTLICWAISTVSTEKF